MISEPHFGNTWKSQVKVEVSHHAFSDGQWSCTKPLVFVMDDPPNGEVKKEKTKKKTVPITQKKSEATSTSIRSSPRRWWSLRGAAGFLRCIVLCIFFWAGGFWLISSNHYFLGPDQIPLPRLDCSAAQGAKVITPIRPVMCLNQNLDLSDTAIRLM